MNIVKSQDYFDPLDVKQRCHIIGCGSVGSTIAELLTRLGVTKISLYDFDIVESHNIANQMFFDRDIKSPKVEATKKLMLSINPEMQKGIELHPDGYTDDSQLSGYVFLCVDNIDLRRKIAEKNKMNLSIKAMFDFRTRLEDSQHYAARWDNPKEVKNFIKSMDFTHEEAHEATPVTACNIEMGVAPTVRAICDLGIANFMNFIRKGCLKRIITFDVFNFDLDAY